VVPIEADSQRGEGAGAAFHNSLAGAMTGAARPFGNMMRLFCVHKKQQ
jgi:hypothetical protein